MELENKKQLWIMGKFKLCPEMMELTEPDVAVNILLNFPYLLQPLFSVEIISA